MKQKLNIFLLLIVFIFTITSCATTRIQNKISQENWDQARQYVKLSTGITMSYVEMGDPNGEVVILQHGMTDNSRSWSLAAPYFAEAGYHVYLPDLRGQGYSQSARGLYTTITYATDLNAFFEAKNIDKAIVIGHSLGSFTVQTFGLMFPEKCSKIVLVSSLCLRGIQNTRLMGAFDRFIVPLQEDEHPSDAFMDYWYNCTIKEEKYKDDFEALLKNLKHEAQRLPKTSWSKILMGLVASNIEDLYQYYDTQDIPILLLHGDDDGMTESEYQEELIEKLNIKEGCYRNYLGVGHNIQFEIPEQCSLDILYWLQNGKLPQ